MRPMRKVMGMRGMGMRLLLLLTSLAHGLSVGLATDPNGKPKATPTPFAV